MAMRLSYLFAAIAFFLFVGTAASIAAPQINAASGEDVALTFYKMADAKPDFETWAKTSKAFKYQSVTEARTFIRKERERLEKKWIDLDRNGTVLNIRTTNMVDVQANLEKDENDPEAYKLVILLDETRKTFFPYVHAGNNFVVIPRNIETSASHAINRTEAETILNEISKNSTQGVVIDFGVRPFKAYTDKPHKIGKEDQWVLMGDIISITLSSKQTGKPLWSYGADWYVSPKGQEVLDMYKGNQTPTP